MRELHGVMLRERQTRGMVITTAPRFTAGARAEAAAAASRIRRYRMRLLSIRDVCDLLELPEGSSAEPWNLYDITWPQSHGRPGWKGTDFEFELGPAHA